MRSPTLRLLAGLVITLTAVTLYSGYTVAQLRGLRRLQTESIDRNRTDSLLLLRIQNNLNALGLAMRDMLDSSEPYPLSAWKAQFRRIRIDLEDAMAREATLSPIHRTDGQNSYLANSMTQFWDALDRTFQFAERGNEQEARAQIRLSLQARQAALSTAVSRLLVQNNESEERAAAETQAIYARAERDVYLLLAAMLIVVGVTSIYLVHQNRRVFEAVASLSRRRSELARQLISMQETTFRSVSRDLHDEFGQILTAIGAMLQRAGRRGATMDASLQSDLREVREIVQSALDKVRALSLALHPVVLDEVGLETAIDIFLSTFEERTGVSIHYEKTGAALKLDRSVSIHLYRVLQEALNNVVKHSKSSRADVRLKISPRSVVLEVEDRGIGFRESTGERGMGLVSMCERAELVNGGIEFLSPDGGGSLIRLTVPVTTQEVHAGS